MPKAAIVGVTGIVGQQLVVALQRHPWFEIGCIAASERSAGKTYREALKDRETGASHWYCEEEPMSEILEMKVIEASRFDTSSVDVVFTAIDADKARILEPKFALHTPVISTSSYFRYDEDVPILVPGVNSEHSELINLQRNRRGWKGFISPIPNCTTTGLVVTLAPIYSLFGLNLVIMTSMQAMSGGGRNPGVLGLDIIDNVIPYIPREEEKVQTETRKILGQCKNNGVSPANFNVSCTCTRVNVREGHTESVFLSTKKNCTSADVKQAMEEFGSDLYRLGLPSAPARMIVTHNDPFRPQPRIDRDTFNGMATVVGRIREDKALDNGIKYVLVSHNTRMGAARGATLVAELLVTKGFI